MAWTLQTSPGALARTGSGTSVTPACTSTTKGTTLIAVLSSSVSGLTFTMPSGWVEAGTGLGQVQVWYYPDNPGGITSVLCQASATATLTGAIAEFSPNGASVYANLNKTGSASSAESLTVTTSSDPSPGDLGICVFNFNVSTAAAVSWTTPPDWTLIADYTTSASYHSAAYYYIGVPSDAHLAVEGEVATEQTNLYGYVCTLSLQTGALLLSFP
jgi:hypothetical protein